MTKKIATGALAVIAAVALVLAFGEADTILRQLIWTGSWIVVLLLAAAGLRALGAFNETDKTV